MCNAANRTPLSEALRACFPALVSTFILSLFINASNAGFPTLLFAGL